MDRQKVIAELKDIAYREREYLADVTGEEAGNIAEVLEAAAEMLQDQEPVKPRRIDGKRNHFIKCGNCNIDLMTGDKFCSNCGREVNWNGCG